MNLNVLSREFSLDSVGSFGDLRIDRLATFLVKQMQNKMTVCIRKLAGSRKVEVAFSRLMKNSKFSKEKLIRETALKTNEASTGIEHVLVIQDTTEFSFEPESNRSRKGLGRIGNDSEYGFFCHPALAVDASSGTCLGLIDINLWVRGEERTTIKDNHHKLPIEQKETMRWITTAQNSKNNLTEAKLITIIADRESDIYEEFDRVPDSRTHLLTRSRCDRILNNKDKLYATLENASLAGTYELFLPAITGKRTARNATIEVRHKTVEIKRPKGCLDKKAEKSIILFAVEAKEASPTLEGQERIHWRLLTTHNVDSFSSALQIIKWYAQRWIIEQLFRTTKKQGIDVESSQIETADSLIKMAILALISAVKILQLVHARDGKVVRSAEDVFEKSDLPLLEALNTQCEGRTEKQKNAHEKNTLPWAAWVIARLGGWKGYKSERPPGPITMKNGLNSFYAIKKGWQLSQVNMCIP